MTSNRAPRISPATDRPKRGGRIVSSPSEMTSVGADPPEAVGRVMREADVDLRLQGLDGLLVGEASASSMSCSTVPSACARGV
jgi:hypothetical protein